MNKFIIIVITALVLGISVLFLSLPTSAQNPLPVFSLADLAQYNGTDPAHPIYIGLAGRDSSAALHQAGGDIIKRKYPVVGILK